MNLLAVIPARGGSKGIPRKNIRLMNNKPLIYYAINNALLCSLITDVVVTSDDDEILEISKQYGAETIKRAPELAVDAITLDPVIYDAVNKMEQIKNIKYDVIITLQPTSPLLKTATLEQALENFLLDETDTYISAVNNPHLSWGKKENYYYPLYEKRLNRQMLPPQYIECGAFFITKRKYVANNSRMGKKISVYEIPENESIDIDTTNDWIVCENELRKKKIVFRADGYKMLGMGHIYRCLTLAHSMIEHEILMVTNKNHKEGLEKIKSSFLPYQIIECDDDFFELLKKYKPDIIVNDCLDTTKEYITHLKKLSDRVVTMEDLGAGTEIADAVINELYENTYQSDRIFSGEKYVCLREEFLYETPIHISDEVNNVLVIFGGIDPSNLTQKIYKLAKNVIKSNNNVHFIFITGLSYDCKAQGILPDKNIEVINDAKRVSSYMQKVDMAFTSQGRTIFELACMGVPSIVLSQNEREQLHTFARMENGFLNLGLGKNIDDITLQKTFDWLASTPQMRFDMHRLMLKHDYKFGIRRVKNIILGEQI